MHEFVVNYLRDVNPWAWVVHGDPNDRHHVHGLGGSLLLAVVVLAVAGIVAAARRRRDDPFWRFAAYGLLVSPVPGTLTVDRMHSLRMVALPIFLLLFAALALERLLAEPARWGRLAVGLAVAVAVVQGALFQVQFRRDGPDRGQAFEAAYPHVLDRALARGGPGLRPRQRPHVRGRPLVRGPEAPALRRAAHRAAAFGRHPGRRARPVRGVHRRRARRALRRLRQPLETSVRARTSATAETSAAARAPAPTTAPSPACGSPVR